MLIVTTRLAIVVRRVRGVVPRAREAKGRWQVGLRLTRGQGKRR